MTAEKTDIVAKLKAELRDAVDQDYWERIEIIAKSLLALETLFPGSTREVFK